MPRPAEDMGFLLPYGCQCYVEWGRGRVLSQVGKRQDSGTEWPEWPRGDSSSLTILVTVFFGF